MVRVGGVAVALDGCLAWLSFSTCPSASPTFSRPVFGGWFRLFLLGGFGSVCFAWRLPRLSARAFRLSSCVFNGLWLHALPVLLTLAGLTLFSLAHALRASCLPYLVRLPRLRVCGFSVSDPSRPSEPPPAVHLTRGFFRASSRLFGSSCVPRQSGGNCQFFTIL